jgi:hypothetical protein
LLSVDTTMNMGPMGQVKIVADQMAKRH